MLPEFYAAAEAAGFKDEHFAFVPENGTSMEDDTKKAETVLKVKNRVIVDFDNSGGMTLTRISYLSLPTSLYSVSFTYRVMSDILQF